MIPVNNPQDLADAIRDLRQQRRITQYQLAAMVDDTRPHVHSVETGRRGIGFPVALRYLKAFGYGLAIVPLIETAPAAALSAPVAAETPSPGVLGCTGGSEIESGASEAVTPRRRLRECVERWPGAEIDGDYDPRCCRFPKSCSASVYDDTRVSDNDLEQP